MCDNAMHMEALRKARILERQREAHRRIVDQHGQDGVYADQGFMDTQRCMTQQKDSYEQSKALHAEQTRLPHFRVNEEGFNNRYRGRADHAPHVDRMYPIMYPNGDNSDYTCDELRNNRVQNKAETFYEARSKVNGSFDQKVLLDTMPAEVEN